MKEEENASDEKKKNCDEEEDFDDNFDELMNSAGDQSEKAQN
jgi:hypothetical protein